jgi:uncharacterized membrane protein
MLVVIFAQILLLIVCAWVVFHPENALLNRASTKQAWVIFASWNLTALIYAWLTGSAELAAVVTALDKPSPSLPLWFAHLISIGTVIAQVLFFGFCIWVVFDSKRCLRKLGFTDQNFATGLAWPLKFLRTVALFSAWNLTATFFRWLFGYVRG